MRTVDRGEAARLRDQAILLWRYPLVGSFAASGTVAAALGLIVDDVADASSGWLIVVATASVAFGLWRGMTITLLADSVVIGQVFRSRLVELGEISCLDADSTLRIEVDGAQVVRMYAFEGAYMLLLVGVRCRAQYICDQIRSQAEKRGNYAIDGLDGRSMRDLRRRAAVG